MKRPAGFERPAPPPNADRGARGARTSPPVAPPPERRRREQRPDPVREHRERAREAVAAERRARRDLRRATRARKRSEKAEVRRFTQRRRRARITVLVTGGLLATLAGIVAVGAFSPLFALREVEVAGTSRVSAEQIVAAVDDQLGTPLPLIDFGRIERELGAIPLIRSYATESRPPGTLVVRIVERTPVAVLQREGGFELVDSAGIVLEAAPERIPGYPLIDLPTGDVSSVPFTAAAAVLVALPPDLLAQVDTISARTTDDVGFTLVSGQRVVWGGADDSVRKAQHLALLLQQHPGEISEYDVSSPGVGILR